MTPYREASGADILEAPARDGRLRLEVAPRHVTLTLVDHLRLTVTDEFLTLEITEGRRPKRESMRLDASHPLIPTRAHPGGALALWLEEKKGAVARIFAAEPLDLLDPGGLAALREVDKLFARLQTALEPHSGGILRGIELGAGADRMLLCDYGDHYVAYVRPLFRDLPRKLIEVYDDGRVRILRGRRKPLELRCTSRYGVTVLGDHVRFAEPSGADLGSIRVPWITPEDRKELADRFGRMLHQEEEPSRSPASPG